MNVDLFFRNSGGICFLFDTPPPHPLAAVVYDDRSHQFYLEFGEKAPNMLLNIPVNSEAAEEMPNYLRAHLGLIQNGQIQEGLNIPILHLASNMQELNQQNAGGGRDVSGLHDILTNCRFAQAVHREDIANEEMANSILGEIEPAALSMSPVMAQQLRNELHKRPSFEPSTPVLKM